ncbi:hypothetical protein [Neobacillus dielmonensis]|uniref:hypothetical protein n=1 Tax=Neobacillus dielmonensis TaxID=1347369 RepID=UPI0005A9BD4F|nr:hypothetical protein [Neobacillus dielmonensis]
MRRRIVYLIVAIGIAFSLIAGSSKSIFQEGNPIPMLVSTVKLQFSNSDYVLVEKSEKRRKYLSENRNNQDYKTVKEYMKTNGWDYKEQMGSGLIFTKNGEDAVVEVRQYSQHFFIWEIQKAFFN